MGQKKFTDYDAFTEAADGDVLLGVDVSDTTQSGTGTTKKLPVSVLATKIREGTTFKEQSTAAGDFASLADTDKLLGVDVSDSDTAKNLTLSQLAAAQAFATSHVKRVTDITALRALTGMQANQTVEMVTTGRAGLFRWDASDLSAEVTADTQSGIYVAPNSDATGAGGAWVRVYSGRVHVQWFGAGDGEADDDALAAATDYGGPLEWGDGEYRITETLTIGAAGNGVTLDWRSDGARILLDTASPVESAVRIHLASDVTHRLVGRIVLDAQQNSYCGWHMTSVDGNCEADFGGLEVLNIYRSGTSFSRGDGMFFRGGFDRLHLKKPLVKGVLLAAGAGVSQVVGAHGITTARDSTSGLYPIRVILEEPHVEDVYSEDIAYEEDQDGARLFGASSSAADESEENTFIDVIGGQFINCAGRSIKGQCTKLSVSGTKFVRNSANLRAVGNDEVTNQTGELFTNDLTCHYSNGKAPQLVVGCVQEFTHRGPASALLAGITVFLDSGTTLPEVIRHVGSSTTLFARDITVYGGSVEKVVRSFCSGQDLDVVLDGVRITNITECLFYFTSSTGTAPYTGRVHARDVYHTGTPVPFLHHRVTGVVANAIPSSEGLIYGFDLEEKGDATASVSEFFGAPGSRPLGGMGAPGGDGGRAIIYSESLASGAQTTLPAQLVSSGNQPSILLVNFSRTRTSVGVYAMDSGGMVALAGGSDIEASLSTTEPASGTFKLWPNSDLSLNIKNEDSATRYVTVMRLG